MNAHFGRRKRSCASASPSSISQFSLSDATMATENSSPSASGNPNTTPEACSEGEESLRKRKLGFEATSDSATKKSKPNDGVDNRETHSQESGSSKEKNSNDEQSYQGKKSFSIEADVAEDKGSRHNMEDAWVVLPNANLDSTAKLRFLSSILNILSCLFGFVFKIKFDSKF